jgi:hypothetical protein
MAAERLRLSCLLFGARVVLGASGLLAAATGHAQISSDSVPRQRILPSREQVKSESENARFRLGPVRFNPELRIFNAGYNSNVLGLRSGLEIEDYTFSVSGGIRWLIPAGSKLYVVGNATPAYIWYDKLESRRFFGGSYSAFLLGFFNRLDLQLGGFNSKTLTYITSDAQAPVIQTTLDGSLKLEVNLGSRLSAFGNVEVERLRFGGAGSFADTSRLPRTEGAARAGLRFRFNSVFDVTAGYEKTLTEFVNFPELNDNQSDAFLVGLHYDREKFYVHLSGGYRQGKPYNGSSFADYSTPTGGYFLSYFPARSIELQAYGDRRVTYGVALPRFIQSRYGGGVNFRLRGDIFLHAYGTYGTNDFSAINNDSTVTPGHTDTTTDYGGGFTTTIFHDIRWTVTATESRYNSTLPGADSRVLRVVTGLYFDRIFKR